MIYASQLFQSLPANGLFEDHFFLEQPVHQWVSQIRPALMQFFKQCPVDQRIFSSIPPGITLLGDVFIGKNVTLPPWGYIEGPTYIADGCQLRPNVYIRGQVIVGEGCILGNACEFKNALLLDHVQAPHFNYVGDSILGSHAHLGAGCILSNLRFDRQTVRMQALSGKKWDTGLQKLGGLLGDYAEAGCNAVLQPGACLFPNAKVFPCEAFRGTRA